MAGHGAAGVEEGVFDRAGGGFGFEFGGGGDDARDGFEDGGAGGDDVAAGVGEVPVAAVLCGRWGWLVVGGEGGVGDCEGRVGGVGIGMGV